MLRCKCARKSNYDDQPVLSADPALKAPQKIRKTIL